MQLINTQKEFNNICQKLQSYPILFMDTEFYRRKTYFAKLSVVQIATKNVRIILDMLALDDYSELYKILDDQHTLKVFHAPDQDFNIFYHLFGKLPNNVFDTQIAAGVIGMDSIIGYARLCKIMLNIVLDKSMQTANWLERPLRKELLDYAIKDVDYLIPLYRDLSRHISERKLWDTYYTRSKKLLDPANYTFSPEKLLKKFMLRGKNVAFRNILIHLLEIREECAIINDLPREFCATNRELWKLCEQLPRNHFELSKIGMHGKALIKAPFKEKLLDLCNGLR